MSDQLQIIKINNYFDKKDQEISSVEFKSQTLLSLRNEFLPQEIEFHIIVNGNKIEYYNWDNIVPKVGDDIMFVPVVYGGGGGKDILSIILLVTLIYFAPGLVLNWGGVFVEAGKLSLIGTFAAAGIVMGGGMLISSMMPHPQPKLPSFDAAELSQTYGWNPQTTQRSGSTIPRFFGRNKVYGNIIAAHTEPNEANDKQYLNVLISLGRGPIQSITSIKINDQPIENFEDVVYETRLGLLDQSAISFFRETKNEFLPGTLVEYGTPQVWESPDTTFDDLEFDILFNAGIFYANDSGGLSNHSIGIKIEVQKEGDAGWTTLTEQTVTDNRNGALRRTYRTRDMSDFIVSNGYQYNSRVSKTTEDKTTTRYGDDVYIGAIREVLNDDFQYPREVLVGIRALATDQLAGSLRFSCIIEGAIVRVYDGSSWTIEYTTNPAWVLWELFTQPVIENGVSGIPYSLVQVDGEDRYDGLNASQLDLDKFYELSQYDDSLVYGDEKRATFNGGFDFESSLWESILKVCEIARCIPFFYGTTLSLAINKAVDMPSQLFTVGNISKNTFEELFTPIEDLASEIEIHFRNEEKEFKRDIISIVDSSILSKANKIVLELFGIIKPPEAWRAGKLRLNQNKLQRRVANLGADVDSIRSTLGDVVRVQADIPKWGGGGRLSDVTVISGIVSTVTIDKDFTQDQITETTRGSYIHYDPNDGNTYEIEIRLTDDTIEIRTVQSVSQVSGIFGREVTVTSPFSGVPAAMDIYAFGQENLASKDFIITNIKRDGDLRAVIGLLEYNSNVHLSDNSSPEIPSVQYNPLDSTALYVKNLSLKEVANITSNGIISREIFVHFDLPNNYWKITSGVGAWATNSVPYQKAEIYFRISGSPTWQYAGNTYGDQFTLFNVEIETIYQIRVVSVDNYGVRTAFSESPEEEITTGSLRDFEGDTLDVAITGLKVEGGSTTAFVGRDIFFRWDQISDPSVIEEISLSSGNPVSIQITNHPFQDAANITFYNVIGTTELNLNTFAITKTDNNNFTLNGTDGDNFSQFGLSGIRGGIVYQAEKVGEQIIPPFWLKDYEVKIKTNTGVLLRTDHVYNPSYVYSYDKNFQDNVTVQRTIKIEVKARDKYNRLSSNSTIITVTNVVPAQIILTESQVPSGTRLEWDISGDMDLAGYKIWASQSSPVDTSDDDDDLIYKGKDNKFEHFPSSLGVWYYKAAAYDEFGETGLNISAQVSETATTSDFAILFPFQQGNWWTDKDPDAISISWGLSGLCQVIYDGITYDITPGNTNKKYVYWDSLSPNEFSSTDTATVAAGKFKWFMAYNDSGYAFPAISEKIIHAGLIQAASITALQLSSEELITASAQIADAIIISAKIGNLEVETINVANWAITNIGSNSIASTSPNRLNEDTRYCSSSRWIKINEATFVSVGNLVSISISQLFLNDGPGAWGDIGLVMKVKEGSTWLKEYWTFVDTALEEYTFEATFQDSPGVGSVTYELYFCTFNPTSNNGEMLGSTGFIYMQEPKK